MNKIQIEIDLDDIRISAEKEYRPYVKEINKYGT